MHAMQGERIQPAKVSVRESGAPEASCGSAAGACYRQASQRCSLGGQAGQRCTVLVWQVVLARLKGEQEALKGGLVRLHQLRPARGVALVGQHPQDAACRGSEEGREAQVPG